MANRFKKVYRILAIASLIFYLTFYVIHFPLVEAQTIPLEQARSAYLGGQYQQAIAILENYLKTSENEVPAEVYRYLGAAYQQIGQLSQAIENADKAIALYRDKEDANSRRQLATVTVEQAQAYLGLGQNQKAIALLEQAIAIVDDVQNREISARAQGVLGNAYLQSGDYPQAIEAYEQTLAIARDKNWVAIESAALNNLTTASSRLAGKYRRDARLANQEKDESEARRLEQSAVKQERHARNYAFSAVAASQTSNIETTVRALLNLLPFLEPSEASQRSQQALTIASKLPDSRIKVYLLLDLAQHLQQPIPLLEQTTSIAIAIGDKRGLSFAFGALGEVYERMGNYKRALEYAQQAQFVAGEVFAYDSLYRWWWLLGRIYRTTGRL
ncbi:MAG: tetratricopeptide repeat protein, partial [Hydrococcus sp. Prado102]|nr:tetratricopeptide repeat protein [Hydrococcus sp. Prado102]